MSHLLPEIATYPYLLQTLQITSIITMLVVSGIAFSLYTWVIPLLRLAPPSTRVAQFTLTIDKGTAYLMPTSRIMALTLLASTVLMYFHPDSAVQGLWGWNAAAMVILGAAAPWEINFIFPINDEIIAMSDGDGKNGKGKGEGNEVDDSKVRWEDGKVKRLGGLLDRWQEMHIYRIIAPFVAGVISLGVLVVGRET